MPTPFEIIAGPFEAYVAPVGEAFPAINAAVAGNWTLLGAGGSKNYTEDGVLVRPEQTVQFIRSLGTTGPRKAFRTEEDIVIEFAIEDARIETYAKILNDATVTTVGGPPAERNMPLLQGRTVKQLAMLIRGVDITPYGDTAGWHTQWEIPRVVQDGNPETVYRKGEPVALKCTWRALQDDTSGFGTLRARSGT